MQVTNPLVPAQMGAPNAVAALVANAPAASESDRSRGDSGGESGRRGAKVDISV